MLTSKARTRHYIGIDPSATGTGIAHVIVTPENVVRRTRRIAPKNVSGPQRLSLLCNAFLDFIFEEAQDDGVDVYGICIEAASLNSTNRSDTLGQVRGAFNVTCMRHFPIVPREIPPSSLKKFFTGNGNAPKSKMIDAALALEWDAETDDEADAAGLAELAWALDDDSLPLTRKQLEALKGIRDMDNPPTVKLTPNKTLNI